MTGTSLDECVSEVVISKWIVLMSEYGKMVFIDILLDVTGTNNVFHVFFLSNSFCDWI